MTSAPRQGVWGANRTLRRASSPTKTRGLPFKQRASHRGEHCEGVCLQFDPYNAWKLAPNTPVGTWRPILLHGCGGRVCAQAGRDGRWPEMAALLPPLLYAYWQLMHTTHSLARWPRASIHHHHTDNHRRQHTPKESIGGVLMPWPPAPPCLRARAPSTARGLSPLPSCPP